jgi:lysophospholipase L1-like esterase
MFSEINCYTMNIENLINFFRGGERMKVWGQKFALFLLASLLAISFTFGGVPISYANEVSPSTVVYHYLALGDSLTVGYEPSNNDSFIPYGFVDRLYEQALYNGRAEVHNYGIVGLTSEGLRNYLHAIRDGSTVEADDIQVNLPDPRVNDLLQLAEQTKEEIQLADLITLTIGGNDTGDLPSKALGKTDEEIQAIMEERMESYTENVTASLAIIYELNPTVQVVIADQYQPFPPLNQGLYQKLNEVKDLFTDTLTSLVQNVQQEYNWNVNVAYVAEVFTGNEIAFTHIINGDIHPNQKGYLVMANSFAKTIWGTYQTASNDDPLAVIVGGQELQTTPLLFNGRSFLPIRESAETLGANVSWHGPTKTATVTYNGKSVQFSIEANSEDLYFHESKIYISLRSVAESLGFNVTYISKSNTAYINH